MDMAVPVTAGKYKKNAQTETRRSKKAGWDRPPQKKSLTLMELGIFLPPPQLAIAENEDEVHG